jgi:putative DNA methylase
MAQALKPGAPFVFTYHHNSLEAYYPIAVAILDAGLTCSASLPCPAEMSGSIHINKTGSSIIDTVLVCRVTGKIPRRWIVETPDDIANLVREDIERLRAGAVLPTRGDVRCIIFGHTIRLAIWQLRRTWKRDIPIEEKLAAVASYIQNTGGFQSVEQCLGDDLSHAPRYQRAIVREDKAPYGTIDDDIAFASTSQARSLDDTTSMSSSGTMWSWSRGGTSCGRRLRRISDPSGKRTCYLRATGHTAASGYYPRI